MFRTLAKSTGSGKWIYPVSGFKIGKEGLNK